MKSTIKWWSLTKGPGFEGENLVDGSSKSSLVFLEIHGSEQLHTTTSHDTSDMVVEFVSRTIVNDTLKNMEIRGISSSGPSSNLLNQQLQHV